MAINNDFKLIKEKEIGKEVLLKVTQNLMSGRIFVEFTTNDSKLFLQRNFPDTMDGKKRSEEFSKSIKSLSQLRNYFGLKEAQ